jgi:hypothetical protein
MARKIIDVTITAEGRDNGKVFVIEEMPASKAEKWATRVFLSLNVAGVEIPEHLAKAGFAGVAMVGLSALTKISWANAEPLLDEMFTCIKIRPSPEKPEIVRALWENDIEEVATRIKLRDDVFLLHSGFSPAAFVSRWIASAMVATETSLTTKTSQEQSEQSSQRAKPPSTN